MLDEKKKEKKDISYIMRIGSIVKKYIILSFNVSDKIKICANYSELSNNHDYNSVIDL